jgi:ribosomal protein S18 acetylase RimI-like enzyme
MTVQTTTTHDPVTERPTVRRLGPDDLPVAAALLARGFDEEPGNRVLFPDPELRGELAPLIFTKELKAALPYASVFGAEVEGELGGAAIWHPPGVAPRSLVATAELLGGLATRGGRVARGLPELSAALLGHGMAVPGLVAARRRAVARAADGPTWHLAFLATDPAFRGRGLARQLLDHVLERCDRDGLAAWLETTDPVNPPLYERFGFHTVAHIAQAAWMPGLWVMRREPDPGQATATT